MKEVSSAIGSRVSRAAFPGAVRQAEVGAPGAFKKALGSATAEVKGVSTPSRSLRPEGDRSVNFAAGINSPAALVERFPIATGGPVRRHPPPSEFAAVLPTPSGEVERKPYAAIERLPHPSGPAGANRVMPALGGEVERKPDSSVERLPYPPASADVNRVLPGLGGEVERKPYALIKRLPDSSASLVATTVLPALDGGEVERKSTSGAVVRSPSW